MLGRTSRGGRNRETSSSNQQNRVQGQLTLCGGSVGGLLYILYISMSVCATTHGVAGSYTWSNIRRGSGAGEMFCSALISSVDSCLTAGSGVLSAQRDSGWLFSGL